MVTTAVPHGTGDSTDRAARCLQELATSTRSPLAPSRLICARIRVAAAAGGKRRIGDPRPSTGDRALGPNDGDQDAFYAPDRHLVAEQTATLWPVLPAGAPRGR